MSRSAKARLEEMAAEMAAMRAQLEELPALREDLAKLREASKRRRKRNANWLKSQSELPWREWMPRYLEVLEATGNVSAARRAIKEHVKSSATVYAYRNRCETFRLAWKSAEALARERQRKRKAANAAGEATAG